MKLSVLIGSIFLTSAAAHAGSVDHARLNWFADPSGQIKTIATPADWQLRRRAILSGMQQVMGPLPDRSKLAAPVVQIRHGPVSVLHIYTSLIADETFHRAPTSSL